MRRLPVRTTITWASTPNLDAIPRSSGPRLPSPVGPWHPAHWVRYTKAPVDSPGRGTAVVVVVGAGAAVEPLTVGTADPAIDDGGAPAPAHPATTSPMAASPAAARALLGA